jgi:hypothetical protein
MTNRDDSAGRNDLMRPPLTEECTRRFMMEIEELETLEERVEAVLQGVETMAGVKIKR